MKLDQFQDSLASFLGTAQNFIQTSRYASEADATSAIVALSNMYETDLTQEFVNNLNARAKTVKTPGPEFTGTPQEVNLRLLEQMKTLDVFFSKSVDGSLGERFKLLQDPSVQKKVYDRIFADGYNYYKLEIAIAAAVLYQSFNRTKEESVREKAPLTNYDNFFLMVGIKYIAYTAVNSKHIRPWNQSEPDRAVSDINLGFLNSLKKKKV